MVVVVIFAIGISEIVAVAMVAMAVIVKERKTTRPDTATSVPENKSACNFFAKRPDLLCHTSQIRKLIQARQPPQNCSAPQQKHHHARQDSLQSFRRRNQGPQMSPKTSYYWSWRCCQQSTAHQKTCHRPLRRHGSMSYESDRFENCIAERCREHISPALPYPPVQR